MINFENNKRLSKYIKVDCDGPLKFKMQNHTAQIR